MLSQVVFSRNLLLMIVPLKYHLRPNGNFAMKLPWLLKLAHLWGEYSSFLALGFKPVPK
jgi:hypothetical protein